MENSFKGIGFHHKETNFLLNGSIDDIWIKRIFKKKNHSLIIKSTTKSKPLSYDEYMESLLETVITLFVYFMEKFYLCPKLK